MELEDLAEWGAWQTNCQPLQNDLCNGLLRSEQNSTLYLQNCNGLAGRSCRIIDGYSPDLLSAPVEDSKHIHQEDVSKDVWEGTRIGYDTNAAGAVAIRG